MKDRNLYYGDPKLLDLEVMRRNAIEHSSDKRFGSPAPVVLHHHKHGVDCSGHKHERFENGTSTT
jgi:hypothetical protein